MTNPNQKTPYRIATWNVERPKPGTKKTKLALNKIKEINADVLVLTETSNSINLSPEYSAIKSIPFERSPQEQWVTIWSKWEIVKAIETFDPKRTACALIKAPFGELIIYGTIIPYHMAGVSGIRYEQKGYKAWQFHYEDIGSQSADWEKIRSHYPNAHLLVIGDFNQTRDELPKGYGTNIGREILTKELIKNNLSCLTGLDFGKLQKLSPHPKTGIIRRNIDHICISNDLLNSLKELEVHAWNNFTLEGLAMSDHNGVYIDFRA